MIECIDLAFDHILLAPVSSRKRNRENDDDAVVDDVVDDDIKSSKRINSSSSNSNSSSSSSSRSSSSGSAIGYLCMRIRSVHRYRAMHTFSVCIYILLTFIKIILYILYKLIESMVARVSGVKDKFFYPLQSFTIIYIV